MRKVSPIANLSAVGVTATSLTACATVIVAVPEAEPDVAVIVAVPLPVAVTSLVASTLATAVLPLDQVTTAPAIA